MPNPKLFAEGWRQGSLIRARLSVRTLDIVGDGIGQLDRDFEVWLLATQDCDLDQTRCSDKAREFELRPVFDAVGPQVDGVRSRTLSISETTVLKADGPKLTLTARALHKLKPYRENSLSDVKRREIKTWLGLRYDRPAVPVPFDQVAMEDIHPALFDHLPTELEGRIRDVLVYYESATDVRLFAVLRDSGDREICIDWLDDAAKRLGSRGISVVERHAEDGTGTSLAVIETYYGLTSSELSLSAEGILIEG